MNNIALFKKNKKIISNIKNYNLEELSFLKSLGVDTSKENINELTFLACLRILSESMGSIPIELIKKDFAKGGSELSLQKSLFKVLNRSPNFMMNPSTFWSAVETNRIRFGNAYIYINRSRNKGAPIKDLRILDSRSVTMLIDDIDILKNNKVLYSYNSKEKGQIYIKSRDIIHLKSISLNGGLTGVSLPELIDMQIKSLLSGQEMTAKMNKNDMNGAKAIVHYTGDLDDKKRVNVAKKIEKNLRETDTGKFIPLPVGMKVERLDISMKDAQFIEGSKLNAMQIASVFGIRPAQLNDNSQVYSNSDSQIRDFYKNTLRVVIKQYKEELENKLLTEYEYDLGYRIRFNADSLLESDLESRIEMYSKAIQNGIYTPEEARNKENLTKKEHGDMLMVNGALNTLENIKKGGESEK